MYNSLTMKYLTTKNFLLALAFLAILHSALECIHLSDKDRVTMFILTLAEICFLDFFLEKLDMRVAKG